MTNIVESGVYRPPPEIETLLQTDPTIDFGWADSEKLLLDSLGKVRDEIRSRYQNRACNPLFAEDTSAEDPQIGWIYCYQSEVHVGRTPKNAAHQDYVRVYDLSGNTIAPDDWDSEDIAKESHLEEDLTYALEQLLGTTELNLDQLEASTREAIAKAQQVQLSVRSKQK